MSPKAKLKVLLEAQIVLRNLGLDCDEDTPGPIMGYRCHKAALEIGEIRQQLKKDWKFE